MQSQPWSCLPKAIEFHLVILELPRVADWERGLGVVPDPSLLWAPMSSSLK